MTIYLMGNGGWKQFEIENYDDIEFKKRNILIGNRSSIGEYAHIGANFIIGEYARIVSIAYGYKYPANAYFNLTNNKEYIRLGCYIQTVDEWEKNFDNNQD